MDNVVGQALIVIQETIALGDIDTLQAIVQTVFAALTENTASMDAVMEDVIKILVLV